MEYIKIYNNKVVNPFNKVVNPFKTFWHKEHPTLSLGSKVMGEILKDAFHKLQKDDILAIQRMMSHHSKR
jgi:hypothetical protein